jgi:hypothetical protein
MSTKSWSAELDGTKPVFTGSSASAEPGLGEDDEVVAEGGVDVPDDVMANCDRDSRAGVPVRILFEPDRGVRAGLASRVGVLGVDEVTGTVRCSGAYDRLNVAVSAANAFNFSFTLPTSLSNT